MLLFICRILTGLALILSISLVPFIQIQEKLKDYLVLHPGTTSQEGDWPMTLVSVAKGISDDF